MTGRCHCAGFLILNHLFMDSDRYFNDIILEVFFQDCGFIACVFVSVVLWKSVGFFLKDFKSGLRKPFLIWYFKYRQRGPVVRTCNLPTMLLSTTKHHLTHLSGSFQRLSHLQMAA